MSADYDPCPGDLCGVIRTDLHLFCWVTMFFPSTIVGSSVSVGSSNQGSFGSSNQVSSDNNRLPPGSAGFGTVEAIDLGSVFINPTQQTLNTIEPQSQSLQVVSNNQGSFGSSNQGSFGSSNQGTFGSNNQGSLFTPVQPQSQSSNPGSFGSSNQGSFGSSNQGSFGQSFTPLQSANVVEQSQESFLKLTNPMLSYSKFWDTLNFALTLSL